jgi:LCP family protein required for cell wall assembly
MFKSKRLRKRFYTSFILTLICGLAIVAATVVLLRLVIVQPTVPAHAVQPFFPETTMVPQPNRPASDVAVAHPDDIFIEPPDHEGWERKEDFFTLLLFGYDGGLNTDTIMVAAFDAANQQAYIVSIPRDTRIDVQRNIQRINSAYPVGRQGGRGHNGGVEQLKREVQTIIGFMPDFYVSIEEHAFVRIVDAVNGVNINVPFHMYYTDPYQDLYINIPAGPQRLNGQNALHFVRYRYGNDRAQTISDYRRMQHQQQLIRAMMNELLSPATVLRVPELIRTYRDHVSTDLSLSEKLWFAEQFILGDVSLSMFRYPTTSQLDTHWYEIPDTEEALELINRTINPFTRDLTVENLRIVN